MPLFSFLPLLLFGRQGDGVYNLYLLDKKKLRFGSPMSLSIYSASKKKKKKSAHTWFMKWLESLNQNCPQYKLSFFRPDTTSVFDYFFVALYSLFEFFILHTCNILKSSSNWASLSSDIHLQWTCVFIP